MEHPAVVAAAGLAGPSYHYWTGRPGHDYVHSVYRPHEAPQIAGATLVLVKRRDGRRIPLAVSETGSWPALVMNGPEYRATVDEVHVHVPAEPTDASTICDDIAAAVETSLEACHARAVRAMREGGYERRVAVSAL